MKFVLMFGAVILGVAYGYIFPIKNPRPAWWKIIAVVLVALGLITTFWPHVAANSSVIPLMQRGVYDNLNFRVNINPSETKKPRKTTE
jgi:hypothetical protein